MTKSPVKPLDGLMYGRGTVGLCDCIMWRILPLTNSVDPSLKTWTMTQKSLWTF